MKKWNFILDVALCQGCNNCFLSCKDEFFENDYPPFSAAQPRHGHRWMNISRIERGTYPKVDVAYLPEPCMQCDNAPCVRASKNGAVYKRDDGIVIIDPEKAKGRREIVDSCPYKAIWWNDEKQVPQKCTFCVHLLEDGWKQPRCVQACPTGALRIVRMEDGEMKKCIAAESLEVSHPEFKTAPRVYYQNLFRFQRCFIAGSVAFKDTDECAEGSVVNLLAENGNMVAEVRTNNYGDFKLDGLEAGAGPYRVAVSHPGYQSKILAADVAKSVNLGTIFLKR